jgi:hypothetical protein
LYERQSCRYAGIWSKTNINLSLLQTSDFSQTSDFDADPTLPKSSVRFTSCALLSGFYGIVLPGLS